MGPRLMMSGRVDLFGALRAGARIPMPTGLLPAWLSERVTPETVRGETIVPTDF